jgi:N-acylneuraminate cytidylyltransferase
MNLVVIPARGGSKGVPGKNIKLLNGKPLIHYTIEAARAIFSDDEIIVSTESEEIRAVAEETGLNIPFLRPAELATDYSTSQEVLLHALEHFEKEHGLPQNVILLQPTSPFRTAAHIKEALQLKKDETEMIVSVFETKANPYFVLREEDKAGWLVPSKKGSFTRRQDAPKVYELNGAIYIINPTALKNKPIAEFTNVQKYVMDEHSSHDIDTPLDWKIAEILATP